MSEKMRATTHNGRRGKDGAFTAKHNDRNFDTEKDKHINSEKSKDNWYWHCYKKTNPNMTFEDVETKFYTDVFGKRLDIQNERHRKAGNLNRIKTIDDYRKAGKTCPEETLLQVGKKGNTIPPALLQKLAIEQINWQIETFPNVKVLDAGLHVDEKGAVHFHERHVWVAHSKDGLVVSQNKALEEMGIERPDMSQEKDRYNNPKMTYTKQCRDHFLSVCKKYGLDIETVPKETSKSGLSLLEYQRQQEEEKLKKAKIEQKTTEKAIADAKELAKKDIDIFYDTRETSLNAQIRSFKKTREEFAKEKENVLKMANMASEMRRRNEVRKAELDRRQAELDKREKSFTNSQKKKLNEMLGTASYIGSMSQAQLKKTMQTMQEYTQEFDAALRELNSVQSGMEV